jgi:heme exporter protein A
MNHLPEQSQDFDQGNFLTINNISKEFDGHRALKNISFGLSKGDFLSLFGPNGAGKSTLLNIIATLTRPSKGKIEAKGFDLIEEPELFRRQLGVISHNSLLYDRMTARENLIFYGKMYQVDKPESRAEELLNLVNLYSRRDSVTGQFSRGMRQRLSIARALVNDPAFLLLDEPYSGLDQYASSILTEQLHKLKDKAKTIIMVTHNLTQGLVAATKVGILANGTMPFFANRQDVSSHSFDQCYLEQIREAGSR